ncbi:hypothetical protein [Veillonella denticariosi]|uniref:hypothetical protein n=1 Tax=Veillonella TaxID=29465 RepID=UPI0003E246C9|nr:hypothetical protein [Veillonella denticariosi]ETS93145.1 hypothetical protein HMPREF1521_0158 [Veillonella sp. AS16]
MDRIIESCKNLDYSWLPQTVGDFSLFVTEPDACTAIQKRIAAGEKVMTVPLFHYENTLGWRWCALYDKEVEDYTVHVELPLFSFVDISFVRADLDSFWAGLQERCVKGLTNMLINPSENFTFTYKRRGIPTWNFSEVMPDELEGFVRDVDPAHAICMINGSFIIGEYRKMDECTGLLLYYNELRDEFFAELRYKNYPEIDHHLDAKNLDDLSSLLREYLQIVLHDLNERSLQESV